MAKRSSEAELEGSAAKMRREEADEGGAGRTGRVRKKSAKLLEMEEFEQVEKTHQAGKKGKAPKGGVVGKTPVLEEDDPSAQIAAPVATPKLKTKASKVPAVTLKSSLATNLMQAPIAVAPAPAKSTKSGSAVKGAQLNKPVSQFVPVQSSGILSTSSAKPSKTATEMLASVIKKEIRGDQDEEPEDVAVKPDQPQSVIKYLLSSPSSGTKTTVGSAESGAELVGGGGKKTAKKSKIVPEKAGSSGKAVKPKSAKQKLDLSLKEEAVEGGDDDDDDDVEGSAATAGLKMRISASSDPQAAQVTLNLNSQTASVPEKVKKSSKKMKVEVPELAPVGKTESDDLSSSATKKVAKKVSKKKEKLIQDVISAVKQTSAAPSGLEPGKPVKKKKKHKVSNESSAGEVSQDNLYIDYGGEESNLVIAETEKKKKKTLKKKKSSLKEKGLSIDLKVEDEKPDKKLSKRAPTAYMLFCNTHRPGIVNQNPGIEFAGISRKLGEMWQTLSTKQKLQWRRKAQRRMKRGSNLISTGKAAKDTSAPQASVQSITPPTSGSALGNSGNAALVRYINMANRSPVETPQSPTKLNFSIEPVDVAAHLKLLGESLSIIGMRLQEHKGMIAVQGSLSVLLDSLLCACGPLLCLTQQVPDMDGCDPLVHGQTLDSVAYVMPGL